MSDGELEAFQNHLRLSIKDAATQRVEKSSATKAIKAGKASAQANVPSHLL